jgi:hypothetical protein
MPATSKAQQKAAGAALAAKRGEQPKSKLKGASKQMQESMSESSSTNLPALSRRAFRTRRPEILGAPRAYN